MPWGSVCHSADQAVRLAYDWEFSHDQIQVSGPILSEAAQAYRRIDYLISAILPPDRDRWLLTVASVLLTGGSGWEICYRVGGGEFRPHYVRESSTVFRDAHGRVRRIVGQIVLSDRRLASQSYLEGQAKILAHLTTGQDLIPTLVQIVHLIEGEMHGGFATVMLLNPDGQSLRAVAAPSLPPDYLAAVQCVPIGPEIGACGVAAYTHQRASVENISTDPRCVGFEFIVERFGLHSCASLPILRHDGELLGTFAVYHTVAKSADDELWSILELCSDLCSLAISHHQQREALLASESRLRTIVERMPVMIEACDCTGAVVFRNRECERVTGAPAATTAHVMDALGETNGTELGTSLCAESDRSAQEIRLCCPEPSHVCRPEDIAEGGSAGPTGHPLQLLHETSPADGADRTRSYATGDVGCSDSQPDNPPVRTSVVPHELEIRDKLGTTRTVSWFDLSDELPIPGWKRWGVGVDVTPRVLAELKRRESQELYELLSEHMSDCITLHGIDGQVLFCSRSSVRLTGFTPEETIQHTGWDFIHPDDLQQAEQAHLQNLRGEPARTEWRCLREDGQYVWVETVSTPVLNEAGELLYSVCTTRNIQDRRDAEESTRRLELQLRHTQRLESLGLLAGSIAHDFNNLLTPIRAYASLVKSQLPADSSLRGPVREIDLAAKAAAELCQQMLAFAGRSNLHFAPTSLDAITRETLALLRHSVSKRATLQVLMADELPPVMADPSQIRQLLLNLVMNASESLSDAAGTIEVTGRSFRTREPLVMQPGGELLPVGQYVQLAVSDTGSGMSFETMQHVLEPFYSTKAEGRGLGLAAVAGIVRRHAGGIDLHSEVGRGTTVTIYFPVSQPAEAQVPTASDAGGTLVTPESVSRALLVDDEELVRRSLSRVLLLAGIQVVTAKDMDEALKYFEQHHRELSGVILDLTLPDGDGQSLAIRMRKLDPEIPVILMTGCPQGMGPIATDSRSAFLQKPFDMDEFLAAWRRISRQTHSSTTVASSTSN